MLIIKLLPTYNPIIDIDKKVLFTFSAKTRAFRKRFTLITKRFYLIIQSVSFPIFLHAFELFASEIIRHRNEL